MQTEMIADLHKSASVTSSTSRRPARIVSGISWERNSAGAIEFHVPRVKRTQVLPSVREYRAWLMMQLIELENSGHEIITLDMRFAVDSLTRVDVPWGKASLYRVEFAGRAIAQCSSWHRALPIFLNKLQELNEARDDAAIAELLILCDIDLDCDK